jgi:hypothetical protein
MTSTATKYMLVFIKKIDYLPMCYSTNSPDRNVRLARN